MCNNVKLKAEQFLQDLLIEPNLGENESLKVGRYGIAAEDLQAEVVNWCLQYLALKKCPTHLLWAIVNRAAQKRNAFLEGDLFTNGIYDSAKVTQLLISTVQEIVKSLLDGDKQTLNCSAEVVDSPTTSECSERNRRRTNEDRFVVIPDLMSTYELKHPHPLGFYAVFDGHGGTFAASYSAVHLPYFLASNLAAGENCLTAISNAFNTTDSAFSKKCEDVKVRGGTTAVCALYDAKQSQLHVGWAGDSKALLVKEGQLTQIVRPHIPTDPKESQRITEQGGSIMYWGGVMRVNGALAVSRSIGDVPHKPFISSEPDIETVDLNGKEDFVVLSSDGLWDVVSEEAIANEIYSTLRDNCEEVGNIARKLVNTAKNLGASDNITVVVIFLKDPQRIAEQVRAGLIPLLDCS